MSDDVSRLKKLLFESESQTLTDLTRRMDDVYARAGTTERFTASVATVLDDALRQAEVDRHSEVSHAIAPLIVHTIKSEIRNSQDELAEMLYPSLGRMVKAYVVSAIRDLMDEINRRLESNAFMLRLRSLISGRSVAELAFAEGQRLSVEEIFLIDRSSGALLGHWPPGEQASTRDKRLSGVLTAINEVATEAFEPDQTSLRRIDVGKSIIFLRASPVHLLAAKCRGVAPQFVEQLIDESFLDTVERLRTVLQAAPADRARTDRAVKNLLGDLQTSLESIIAAQQAKMARRRSAPSPAVVLLFGIALAGAAWTSWSIYDAYLTSRARARATAVLSQQGLLGYPVDVEVKRRGGQITLHGLVPNAEAGENAERRIREALPSSHVANNTTALPSGLEQARADIAALKSSLESLNTKLTDMSREARDADTRRQGEIAEISRRLQETETLRQKDLKALRTDLAKLNGSLDDIESARKADVADLRDEIARAVAPSPRQRLQAWISRNALFFARDTDYRDAPAAAGALTELAQLMQDTDVILRVVGHTDEKGGEERNAPLSQARAEKVVTDLVERGIARSRLIAVGRNDSTALTPEVGEASTNRRVVFEIGFNGEGKS
jgi:outer membrane protein OmpA-like peptidoglycan-associated protein